MALCWIDGIPRDECYTRALSPLVAEVHAAVERGVAIYLLTIALIDAANL